jgi:hypothetical protein
MLRNDGTFPDEDDALQRQPTDNVLDDADTEPLDDDSNELPVDYPGLDDD